MSKLYTRFAICAIGVALTTAPIAWAQTYSTVDYPGATATTLNGGPNPEGTNIGGYTDTSGITHGFVLKKGVFTSFDPPGSTLTIPNFISPQGVIVGAYNDSGSVSHGFVLDAGKYTTLDFPGAAGTTLTGLSPSGEFSGIYCSDPACGSTGNSSTNHSFVVSKKGAFTSFDPPGAVSSEASAVNPSGAVVGSYDNLVEGTCFTQCHGYLLYHGKFTTIDFPGANGFTGAGGANARGDSVGVYKDTSGIFHSFLLSNGSFTSFDPPGAVFSDAAGINPGGIIVGLYFDSSNVEHGYMRTP
jgi:hypothetical protein